MYFVVRTAPPAPARALPPRLVYFLYFADAFHKAAANTSLLISTTWEIEDHRK